MHFQDTRGQELIGNGVVNRKLLGMIVARFVELTGKAGRGLFRGGVRVVVSHPSRSPRLPAVAGRLRWMGYERWWWAGLENGWLGHQPEFYRSAGYMIGTFL